MNYNFSQLNRQPHLSILTSSLRVAPFAVGTLLELNISQKINLHGSLYLKAVLADTQKESGGDDREGYIALWHQDAAGEEYILYQGIVCSCNIYVEQDVRIIEIYAVSYSYLLDIEKKSRSFQDKKKTYTALVKQIANGYPDADIIDTASEGIPTKKFIVQHMETDWEFLKRLASHFNAGLVCDVRFNKPNCFFGIPEGQKLKFNNSNYSVKKDMQRFNVLSKNGVSGLTGTDFICYEVETNCITRIGDEVTFRQKQMYVSEITSTAQKGVFVSRLILSPKPGLKQPYRPNANAAGASFGGSVLESKNDTVKVSLDIDSGHDPGKPCFFPYSTIYSSPDGSGWYCMPETGDRVRVYFPDGEDDHAYAISSVHGQVNQELTGQSQSGGKAKDGGMRATGGAGTYSGQRDDPDVKSFTYGDKEVRLTPEGVYIIMESSMISMTPEGIMLMSENDIAFKADKNITLSAEQDVSIVGNSGVEIMCGETAGVMIEDNVQVIGQEVKAN